MTESFNQRIEEIGTRGRELIAEPRSQHLDAVEWLKLEKAEIEHLERLREKAKRFPSNIHITVKRKLLSQRKKFLRDLRSMERAF